MATASNIQTIPQTITSKLQQLRRRLTNWILVHGIGRWLMLLLGLLAFDMALDRLFKMDFAQRLIMLVVILCVAGFFFLKRVLRPLQERPNDDALIYEVEAKNPELNESFISSYQLAREQQLLQNGVSPDLANETIKRGMEQAEKIDFGKTLDTSKSFTNWLILGAGLLLFGILSVGVTQNDFLKTWFNRNIMLGDAQWPQSTYLEIVGAVDGNLVIPRGSDQRQLVRITDDSSETNVSVNLEVEGPTGKTLHSMKPTGKLDGREHVFVFHNVSSEFRVRASGGDDVTEWVQVRLVEPPSIESLEIVALPPAYTQIESLPLAGSGPHSVLTGSRLAIRLSSNKALQSCSLMQGDITIPMNSTADGALSFEVTLPTEGESLAGGDYEFELIDESGLAANRPSKFSIAIKDDEAPKVRAELLGISGMIVPEAMIPVNYKAVDDFGVNRLTFDCRWKASDDVDEESPVAKRMIEFPPLDLSQGPMLELNDVNVLEAESLKLSPGTTFRFFVDAYDACPDPVGQGKSQEFVLQVVTEEELRADLMRREEEQRKAFEQAYNSQLELSAELQAIAASRQERKTLEEFDSERESRLITIHRDQKLVGTSLDRIATRFEEFLVEVHNNRLDIKDADVPDSQTITGRFDQQIIQPIRRLDSDFISVATRNLDKCRLAVRNHNDLAEAVAETAQIQQQILDGMKQILDAMIDSENFQKAVNAILDIKREQERVKRETQNKKNADDIFEPENEDDIFDDG